MQRNQFFIDGKQKKSLLLINLIKLHIIIIMFKVNVTANTLRMFFTIFCLVSGYQSNVICFIVFFSPIVHCYPAQQAKLYPIDKISSAMQFQVSHHQLPKNTNLIGQFS